MYIDQAREHLVNYLTEIKNREYDLTLWLRSESSRSDFSAVMLEMEEHDLAEAVKAIIANKLLGEQPVLAREVEERARAFVAEPFLFATTEIGEHSLLYKQLATTALVQAAEVTEQLKMIDNADPDPRLPQE